MNRPSASALGHALGHRPFNPSRLGILVTGFLVLGAAPVSAGSSVHTTWLWHLDQPIYWPDQSLDYPERYQRAWESMTDSGDPDHPEDNLEEIFGKSDRIEVYQYSMADAIASISTYPEAGAQSSYPGELMENVSSLAEAGWNYADTWNATYADARTWKTSGGFPRLDLVSFTFHHTLAPLAAPQTLRKEIALHREYYAAVWGSDPVYSRGFFPSEAAFSTRMIPTLRAEGLEWVIVGSNHLSRACTDYPFDATEDNTVPPNAADQLNPAQGTYYEMSIDRGITTKDAYPFALRPHYAQYIDPVSGEISRIIVVPMAQGMSWDDGYAPYGTSDIDAIAQANDETHPMLILLGHDGDNAYAGGWTYYHENVASFAAQAAAQGYTPTTVENYLADHPLDPGDIVHVEDGAWVNADGDFGAPQFINWLWPPVNESGEIDVIDGWGEDFRNWAVLVAAQHRVIHAEAATGEPLDLSQILWPRADALDAERAWHFLLPGFNSGFMYYGASLDHEVKATVAANNAMTFADRVIADAGDSTGPTVFIPQRSAWNPGGYCAGALCDYTLTSESADFYVWTFAYDTSGITEATLLIRVDNDGLNPMDSNANELYSDSSEVGPWISIPMDVRPGSEFVGNIYNDPEIDFDEMPLYIADEYYALVDGYRDVLLDYYVEAIDRHGNRERTPIQHVYVGTQSAPEKAVIAEPDPVEAGAVLTIRYDTGVGSLPETSTSLRLHWGYDGWNGITDSDMLQDTDNPAVWSIDLHVPIEAETSVDFVFTDGTSWDNNGGADYHVGVSMSTTPTPSPTPRPSPTPSPTSTPDANTPPVADAGPNQIIEEGSPLILDGSASFDPDGDALTYSWTLDDIELGNQMVVEVEGLEAGTYEAVLRVSDGISSDSDTARVSVVGDDNGGCGGGNAWPINLGIIVPFLLMGGRRRHRPSA